MLFVERYSKFIDLCRETTNGNQRIPEVQVSKLEREPRFNPNIIPEPRDWFIKTFDWYIGLKLVRGHSYGPFYRVDGEYFWPQIGNLFDEYSESKCFFGMEKPTNQKDVQDKYNIQSETGTSHIYEISITMPRWPIIDDAYIFLGAVKDGTGYQVNPNRRVVELIRSLILNGDIRRFSKSKIKSYNYSTDEKYTFIRE